MPTAEGLVEGDGLEGGGAASDGARPAAASAGVATGLWAADRERTQRRISLFRTSCSERLSKTEFLDRKATEQTPHRAFLHPAAGSSASPWAW